MSAASHAGRQLVGPFGSATEVVIDAPGSDNDATVACWLLHCPGQSPAWAHYLLSAVHLRAVVGGHEAEVRVPGATHEVLLLALDPEKSPVPDNPASWAWLLPLNVQEQVQLGSDDQAADLVESCVRAMLAGNLPAEPALAGAVEPWRTVLVKTAAHARGEEHAP